MKTSAHDLMIEGLQRFIGKNITCECWRKPRKVTSISVEYREYSNTPEVVMKTDKGEVAYLEFYDEFKVED